MRQTDINPAAFPASVHCWTLRQLDGDITYSIKSYCC